MIIFPFQLKNTGRPRFKIGCQGGFFCLLLSVLASLSTQNADARIGFTEEECIELYGEVVERRREGLPASDDLMTVFRAGAFVIQVQFKEGRAWRIDYRKGRLDEVDVEQVLDWNQGEQPWGTPFSLFDERYWMSADGKVLVRTLRGVEDLSVIVMTREHLDANAVHRQRLIEEEFDRTR